MHTMLKKGLFVSALALSTSQALAQTDEVKPFSLDGEFGFIFTSGNTETTSLSGALTASQELENWSNDYVIKGLYRRETTENSEGIEESNTSAQKFFASAQGAYKLENPDHRLFGFASYEDDRFNSFEYQASIAIGWSQKLWETDTSNFEYSIGPGYTFQETEEGENQDSEIIRASMAYEWKISDTAKFVQTISTEVGSENTKSRAESGLSATISGGLSMKLSVKLDHNTQVEAGRENLDTETAVTLVYSFF